jgi:hypothetical protein
MMSLTLMSKLLNEAPTPSYAGEGRRLVIRMFTNKAPNQSIQTHLRSFKSTNIKWTKEYGISFGPNSTPHYLTTYYDSDYAMDLEDRKSRSGVVLKVNSGPVAWLSRKQPCTASSTTEAEYLVAHVATKELLRERRLLNELGFSQLNPTLLYSDN